MIPRPTLHVFQSATGSLADRAAKAKTEAKAVSQEAVSELQIVMQTAQAAAEFVADDDTALPGVRDIARRYAADTQAKRDTIATLVGRRT